MSRDITVTTRATPAVPPPVEVNLEDEEQAGHGLEALRYQERQQRAEAEGETE